VSATEVINLWFTLEISWACPNCQGPCGLKWTERPEVWVNSSDTVCRCGTVFKVMMRDRIRVEVV